MLVRRSCEDDELAVTFGRIVGGAQLNDRDFLPTIIVSAFSLRLLCPVLCVTGASLGTEDDHKALFGETVAFSIRFDAVTGSERDGRVET
jgi:hypothetical protein